MPIERVPVVHKFGIISQSHRIEIQKRLIEEARLSKEKPVLNTTVQSTRPTYFLGEISEEFLNKLKSEKDEKLLAKLELQAEDILNRIKRLTGSVEKSSGGNDQFFTNIAKCWIDLSLLSQCNGHIQQDALDTLTNSLSSGVELHVALLPSLLYLTEAALYWLKYRAMREAYLRSAEVKLLKVAELVFDRLFCHFLMGDLIGEEEFISRLAQYNEGFLREAEESYSNYPSIIQSLSYISKCSSTIITHSNPSNTNALPYIFNTPQALFDDKSKLHSVGPLLWHVVNIKNAASKLKNCTSKKGDAANSGGGVGLDSSLTDLRQCSFFSQLKNTDCFATINALKLMCSLACGNLSILKTFQVIALTQIDDACSPHLYQTSVDGDSVVIMNGTSSRSSAEDNGVSLRASRTSSNDGPRNEKKLNFQDEDDEDEITCELHLKGEDELLSLQMSTDRDEQRCQVEESNVNQLDDNQICSPLNSNLNSQIGSDDGLNNSSNFSTSRLQSNLEQIDENQSYFMQNSSSELGDANSSGVGPRLRANTLQHSGEIRAASKSLVTEEDIAWDNLALVDKHLWNSPSLHRMQGTTDSTPNSERNLSSSISREEVLGLDAVRPGEARSSRLLVCSPCESDGNLTKLPQKRSLWPNFAQWPSEVAIAYTKMMAHIVLNGATAEIRKAALFGAFTTNSLYSNKNYSFDNIGTENIGLLDLLYFDDKKCDWSWKVRFTAVEKMFEIYNTLETFNDSTREGFRNICWAAINDTINVDPDSRVCEARKLGHAQHEDKKKLISGETGANKCGNNTDRGKVGLKKDKNESVIENESNLYNVILTTLIGRQKSIAEKVKRATAAQTQQASVQKEKQTKVTKDLKTTAKESPNSSSVNSAERQPKGSQKQINTRNQTKPSLREEVLVHSHLCEKPIGWEERNQMGLHRIIEDQWRKELHVKESNQQTDSLNSTPAPSQR